MCKFQEMHFFCHMILNSFYYNILPSHSAQGIMKYPEVKEMSSTQSAYLELYGVDKLFGLST